MSGSEAMAIFKILGTNVKLVYGRALPNDVDSGWSLEGISVWP